jgi:hypothetical protein
MLPNTLSQALIEVPLRHLAAQLINIHHSVGS